MHRVAVADFLELLTGGEPLAALPAFVVGFLVYHFFTGSRVYIRLVRALAPRCLPDACAVAVRRMVFAAVLGAVPAVLLTRGASDAVPWVSVQRLLTRESLSWTLIIVVLMSTLSIVLRRSPSAWRNYPQIRELEWRPATHVLNVATWIPYLFAYEFAYRGYLLFPLVERLGAAGAVAVSVSLYAALHLPRGLAESLGCIPVGFVLAVASLRTGTIWVPFVAHLSAAVLNDALTFRANPAFRTVGSQQPLKEAHDEDRDLLT